MLHIISEHGTENPEQSKLLAALALGAVRHLSAEMAVIGEDDNIRAGWRMARIGDLALLEKPADRSAPRRIDCYLDLEERDFGDGKRFKLDPQRVVFSLRHQHNATPPDFELLLFGDPRDWLGAVTATLLGELNRREPHLFDKLR